MALVRGYCLLKGPPRPVASFGRLWKSRSFPLASWWLTSWKLRCVKWPLLYQSLPFANLHPRHTSHLSAAKPHRLWASLLAKKQQMEVFDGLCASAGAPPAMPDAPRNLPRGGETKTSVVGLAWIRFRDIWRVSGCSRGLSALLDFFFYYVSPTLIEFSEI